MPSGQAGDELPQNQDVTVGVVSISSQLIPTKTSPLSLLAPWVSQPVFWYDGTGHQDMDTFFAHGLYFSPVTFTGIPGKSNCFGNSIYPTLAQQHGGLDAAAALYGYPA